MNFDLSAVFIFLLLIILVIVILIWRISESKRKAKNRQRDEELSDLMHDIKAPLNSIKGFAGGIVDKTIGRSEEDKYLGIIKSEAERVAKLAEDYSVYKMLDSATLVKGRVRLYELICEIILSFEKSITDKNINLTGLDIIEASDEKNAEISGDKNLLHRAFYNLITNAVSYTPDGGEINLSIACGNKTVSVFISNTGELAPQELQKIFVRNYRSENSKGKSGTGLGLSVVKKIVTLHRGSVEAVCEDKKVKFGVILPKK